MTKLECEIKAALECMKVGNRNHHNTAYWAKIISDIARDHYADQIKEIKDNTELGFLDIETIEPPY